MAALPVVSGRLDILNEQPRESDAHDRDHEAEQVLGAVVTVHQLLAQPPQPLGLGQQSLTTFNYKGGLFNRPTCEFRGFRQITQTGPTGAYTVTNFRQDDYVWGKIASTKRYDASDALIVGTEYFYSTLSGRPSPLISSNV